MRQRPIPDESWSEAEAMRLLRGMGSMGSQPDLRRHTLLARTVENEVIPRLLQIHRAAPQPAIQPKPKPKLPSATQIAALVEMALTGTRQSTAAYVLALRGRGMETETLLLDLITPAARRLGVMWEEDTCSFSDVTLGVLHLGHAVQALDEPAEAPANAPTALLAPMPGEQHGLGLSILAQIFRRAGWHVTQAAASTLKELAALVHARHFDIAGLSVACDDQMETLASHLAALRRASRNPHLCVLVGGAPFVVHPELALLVGADATAMDAGHAVRQASRLLAQAART